MKTIFRFLIIIFFLLGSLIVYLSTIGIETTRFNSQIDSIIKNFDRDLKIELKKVKIILDPLKFELNAKTIGPKIKLKDKTIELENIKTQIILNSFINNDFSLKNLDISTRSLEIENLISFIRKLRNTPELYVFEKVLKKGYLICDINLKFDSNGKINENYRIKGIVKDAHIKILKKYDIKKIDLNFNLSENIFDLNDVSLLLNDISIASENIKVKKVKNSFIVDGSFKNNGLELENKLLKNFVKNYFPKANFIDLSVNSKNNFSFKINKNYEVDKLKLFSEIKVNKFKIVNNFVSKKIFPNIKKEISLTNHLITLNFDKENLKIDGNGNVFLQDEEDFITYKILKKKNFLDFEIDYVIDKNPIKLSFLGYEKKSNDKTKIDIVGTHFYDNKTIVKSFKYNENENIIKFEKLSFNKLFKITNFKNIELNYIDKNSRENKIKIYKANNIYNIIGSRFNANSLIENILDDTSNKIRIFEQNIRANIKIDKVYIDEEYVVNDLKGNLNFKKNELVNAEIDASFSKNKKLKFTVNTNELEKVTTLFLDQAEPIVKRYKFIKGFNGGSLDFYSSKKGNKSISNLKIYNFRLKKLPILTKLLTLASLQGIADILSGEGITFDEFEMNFENQINLMTINELYAIGPAISVLMEGYIEKEKLISLRGSLVPATTINKAIGNIPVLGKILVGSKTGEGVFGVSFKIKGPPKNLETTVNPIKTLTPRFITRTLEKIKKLD